MRDLCPELWYLQQLLPFRHRSLLACKDRHHHHIKRRCLPISCGIWNDVLVDEESIAVFLHSSYENLRDTPANVVRPVV